VGGVEGLVLKEKITRGALWAIGMLLSGKSLGELPPIYVKSD